MLPVGQLASTNSPDVQVLALNFIVTQVCYIKARFKHPVKPIKVPFATFWSPVVPWILPDMILVRVNPRSWDDSTEQWSCLPKVLCSSPSVTALKF
jgi:hypothetical protein